MITLKLDNDQAIIEVKEKDHAKGNKIDSCIIAMSSDYWFYSHPINKDQFNVYFDIQAEEHVKQIVEDLNEIFYKGEK